MNIVPCRNLYFQRVCSSDSASVFMWEVASLNLGCDTVYPELFICYVILPRQIMGYYHQLGHERFLVFLKLWFTIILRFDTIVLSY